jgi:3-methylcrotonyl-CoA carboxylase beta subunit
MGGEQAANTLAEVKLRQLARGGGAVDPAIAEEVKRKTLEAFTDQLSSYHSTSELWDDGMLDPVDTRNALGIALSAAASAPLGTQGYGVFRM